MLRGVFDVRPGFMRVTNDLVEGRIDRQIRMICVVLKGFLECAFDTASVIGFERGNDAMNDDANTDDGDRDERPAAMSHVFVRDRDDHVVVLDG